MKNELLAYAAIDIAKQALKVVLLMTGAATIGYVLCFQKDQYLNCSLHLIDVTHQQDLRELIIADTGQKTVPAIFLGSEFIGGCDDLINLVETGNIEMKILTEENRILKEEVKSLRRSL